MDRGIVLEKIDKVKKMLNNIEREGMKELIKYMDKKNFFDAPASTRFHGCFKGGLLIHSYNLYLQFKKHCIAYKIPFSEESMIICAFGHDACKFGCYIESNGSFKWNLKQPPGHAKLSIERLKMFIKLSQQEKEIIKFHMGPYGTIEFDRAKGEYSLYEMVNVYNNNKLAKLFYFCDDMSANFLEE